MGLERRQVLRLSKAYLERGATAFISKKRGRPSNRQMPTDIKAQALELIRAKYSDFGPMLAAENCARSTASPLAARRGCGWSTPVSGLIA